MESFFLEPQEKHMELTENINSTTQSSMGIFLPVFKDKYSNVRRQIFRIKVNNLRILGSKLVSHERTHGGNPTKIGYKNFPFICISVAYYNPVFGEGHEDHWVQTTTVGDGSKQYRSRNCLWAKMIKNDKYKFNVGSWPCSK